MNHSLTTLRRGFTLVELLVVIAIIVVLAGIGGAAFVGMQESSKKQKNQTFLKLLDTSLQNYHLDYGAYPVATNANGQGNSDILYDCLVESADPDGTSHPSVDSNGEQIAGSPKITVYAPYLHHSVAGDAYDATSGQVLDPYGNEYLYRDAFSHGIAHNPDFDLWSTGKNSGNEANADADDIINW